MKKTIFLFAACWLGLAVTKAQDGAAAQLQTAVAKLDQANSVKDYQQLADEFKGIADRQKNAWLPFYYAGYCNARIGWLYERDGDAIEPFANKADEEIRKALSLIDTAVDKKGLSEIYCVLSMVNRAWVFINSSTYGIKYGPLAARYTQLAMMEDPNNPRALWLAGWEKFYTPKLWGGSKTKAKELLGTAQKQLDANPAAGVAPHWGRKEVAELLKQLK
jgi:hypothetical protein